MLAQEEKLLHAGKSGQEYFHHIRRALCRGLSKASPAAVMQTLQNVVIAQGKPLDFGFFLVLRELRLLVSKVWCVWHVAPEDEAMQLTLNTSRETTNLRLPARQSFAGRNVRLMPFGTVDDLRSALHDLPLDQTAASPPSCTSGGGGALVMTRSKKYTNAFRGQTSGVVVAVDQRGVLLEDGRQEFQKINVVMQSRGGFGDDGLAIAWLRNKRLHCTEQVVCLIKRYRLHAPAGKTLRAEGRTLIVSSVEGLGTVVEQKQNYGIQDASDLFFQPLNAPGGA